LGDSLLEIRPANLLDLVSEQGEHIRIKGNGIKLSNEALDIALKPECARMSELGTFHPSPGTLACGIGLKQVVQFRPYRF
jgi:hypothetical protein